MTRLEYLLVDPDYITFVVQYGIIDFYQIWFQSNIIMTIFIYFLGITYT